MMRITYDPCESCESKKKFRHCVRAKKTMCPNYCMAQYLKMEENDLNDSTVPIEIFINILRARGWYGDLKKIERVTV